MKIGIIYKENAKDALEFAEDAAGDLLEKGHAVRSLDSQTGLEIAEPAPESNWAQGLDLVIVIGGDGTLLRAAQLVGLSGVPVIGVKLGGLGFLTEIQPHEFPEVLENALEGRLTTMERMVLEGKVVGENGVDPFLALNEITIYTTGMPKIINLHTYINDVFVTSFRADGLAVSTPTGSTAYCMAAGGPIAHPGLRCAILTALTPHTLTSRPLVVPDESRIAVTLANEVPDAHVTADSQKAWDFTTSTRLEVTAAKRGLNLACSTSMNYFEILRTKLRWGER